MALTESNMLELGTEAPYFNLLDVTTGEKKSIDDIASDVATVVMFLVQSLSLCDSRDR